MCTNRINKCQVDEKRWKKRKKNPPSKNIKIVGVKQRKNIHKKLFSNERTTKQWKMKNQVFEIQWWQDEKCHRRTSETSLVLFLITRFQIAFNFSRFHTAIPTLLYVASLSHRVAMKIYEKQAVINVLKRIETRGWKKRDSEWVGVAAIEWRPLKYFFPLCVLSTHERTIFL